MKRSILLIGLALPCFVSNADIERGLALQQQHVQNSVSSAEQLPVEDKERLLSFLREEFGTNTLRNSGTALHLLPYIPRPGIFPQGFFRIANIGDTFDTVTFIMANDFGNVAWRVEVDVPAFETRHVNSNDLAGRSAKSGIRVTDVFLDLDQPATYSTIAESGPNIRIRAFTRSSNGFINDVGSSLYSFTADSGLRQTVLGTANPGSNTTIVGVLRYLNMETRTDEIYLDLWAYDDLGYRSGTVTCRIPKLGSLSVEILELERGGHPDCSGSWGNGTGKWEVHSASDYPHMAMSFLFSTELGILANVSKAEVIKVDVD